MNDAGLVVQKPIEDLEEIALAVASALGLLREAQERLATLDEVPLEERAKALRGALEKGNEADDYIGAAYEKLVEVHPYVRSWLTDRA